MSVFSKTLFICFLVASSCWLSVCGQRISFTSSSPQRSRALITKNQRSKLISQLNFMTRILTRENTTPCEYTSINLSTQVRVAISAEPHINGEDFVEYLKFGTVYFTTYRNVFEASNVLGRQFGGFLKRLREYGRQYLKQLQPEDSGQAITKLRNLPSPSQIHLITFLDFMHFILHCSPHLKGRERVDETCRSRKHYESYLLKCQKPSA